MDLYFFSYGNRYQSSRSTILIFTSDVKYDIYYLKIKLILYMFYKNVLEIYLNYLKIIFIFKI